MNCISFFPVCFIWLTTVSFSSNLWFSRFSCELFFFKIVLYSTQFLDRCGGRAFWDEDREIPELMEPCQKTETTPETLPSPPAKKILSYFLLVFACHHFLYLHFQFLLNFCYYNPVSKSTFLSVAKSTFFVC